MSLPGGSLSFLTFPLATKPLGQIMLHNVIGMAFAKDISFSLERDYMNCSVVVSRGQNEHFSTFIAGSPCLPFEGAGSRTQTLQLFNM